MGAASCPVGRPEGSRSPVPDLPIGFRTQVVFFWKMYSPYDADPLRCPQVSAVKLVR